jgi:hypothetical protein
MENQRRGFIVERRSVQMVEPALGDTAALLLKLRLLAGRLKSKSLWRCGVESKR